MTDTKNATTINNRKEFLAKVDSIVNKDRNTSYGDAEDSFNTIANMWNVYLAYKGSSVKLGALDVAAMMTLLKVARLSFSSEHYDSWIDIAGYAACGGGLAGYMDKTDGVDYKAEVSTKDTDYLVAHGRGKIKVNEDGYAYEYISVDLLDEYCISRINVGLYVYATYKLGESTYYISEREAVLAKQVDYVYTIGLHRGNIIKTYYTDKQVAERRASYSQTKPE